MKTESRCLIRFPSIVCMCTRSDMASHLLESTGDQLGTRMDECCRILHKAGDRPDQRRWVWLLHPTWVWLLHPCGCGYPTPLSSICSLLRYRAAIADSCRSFKELFVEIRERASKALGFAKMLRKVCLCVMLHNYDALLLLLTGPGDCCWLYDSNQHPPTTSSIASL